MAQWKIKQLGDLTGVSVRMLRHYDEIGLLKPSVRTSNGYRLYSEQNLVELQQIVSLKFFGFSLSQIKTMLQQKRGIKEHLLVQQQVLKEQTENLQQTQSTIEIAIQRCDNSKTLNWQNFVALIEKSKMVQEIKKTWASKLDEDQKERYIEIRRKYPKEIKDWEKAVEYINGEQLGDPEGPEGEKIVQAFLAFQKVLIKNLEYRHIFKIAAEKILNEEGIVWFSKAMKIYSKSQKNKNYKD